MSLQTVNLVWQLLVWQCLLAEEETGCWWRVGQDGQVVEVHIHNLLAVDLVGWLVGWFVSWQTKLSCHATA